MTDSGTNGSGTHVEVVVMEEAPFVMSSTQGGKLTYSGFAVDVLEKVSKLAGFDYSIRMTDHVSYGHKDLHGKWNGLVSELEGKTPAHIAVGPIPIISELADQENSFFTLSRPFMSTGVTLLIKNPPEISRNMSVMLEPFGADVWVMVVLAYVVVSLALFLIGHFSPFEWAKVAKERDHRHARKSFGLKNSFLFTASTMGFQGYREAPRSTSGRILICMWFQFTVFVLLGYVGNLAAIFLTRGDSMPRRNVPFHSYTDIVKEKHVKIGALKYSATYQLLRSSTSGPYRDLYRYIDENQEWIQDLREGVDHVSDSAGRYAFLMESAKAEYATATNCDLITFGENIMSFGYGFATPAYHPLRKNINDALLSLKENGELHSLVQKYFVDSDKCAEPSSPLKFGKHVEKVSSLDMTDMAIPFLFLFLGLIAAAVALGAEIYYRTKFMEKREHDKKVREPLNCEPGISKAPRESPPPPPIYKVNNKLQDSVRERNLAERSKSGSSNGADSGKGNSIEMVLVDEKKDLESGAQEVPEVSLERVDLDDDIVTRETEAKQTV